jgi:hypothetical protein
MTNNSKNKAIESKKKGVAGKMNYKKDYPENVWGKPGEISTGMKKYNKFVSDSNKNKK